MYTHKTENSDGKQTEKGKKWSCILLHTTYVPISISISMCWVYVRGPKTKRVDCEMIFIRTTFTTSKTTYEAWHLFCSNETNEKFHSRINVSGMVFVSLTRWLATVRAYRNGQENWLTEICYSGVLPTSSLNFAIWIHLNWFKCDNIHTKSLECVITMWTIDTHWAMNLRH